MSAEKMKILGLIVEYNPFHNGHLYHLEQSKKLCNADGVICVMSGNFIQRGEPALVNKWARANMALLCGVDLVIELPTVYAMSSAESFAYGAVKILDSTGITDYICFGSESGEINELDYIADVLHHEPELYRRHLKEQLSKGLSYPASREIALQQYLNQIANSGINIGTTISSSNNILGIEYLKALKKLKSKIIPITMKRISNTYNSERITGAISSATAIRKLIQNMSSGSPVNHDLESVLPETSLLILKGEFESGRGPVFMNDYEDMILSALRKMTQKQLSTVPYVSEGLENRIRHAVENSGSLEELIEKASTKRYTRTRIQRSLFSILTGITSQEADTFMKYGGPQYLRVLGFNQKGRLLLSQMKKSATLPVIIKTADFKKSCNPLLRRMFEIEALSTDMYVLAYENPDFKKPGQDFTGDIPRQG